jgi:hypothetical protein
MANSVVAGFSLRLTSRRLKPATTEFAITLELCYFFNPSNRALTARKAWSSTSGAGIGTLR